MANKRKTKHAFEHFHGDRAQPIQEMRRCDPERALEIITKLPDGHFINRNEDHSLQLLWILLERVNLEKEEAFRNRQFQLFGDNSKLLKNNNKTNKKEKKKIDFAKIFTRAINKVKYTPSNRIHGAELIFNMVRHAEVILHNRNLSKEILIKDQLEEMNACANKLYSQQSLAQKFGSNYSAKKESNKVAYPIIDEIYDNGEDLTPYHARQWPKTNFLKSKDNLEIL